MSNESNESPLQKKIREVLKQHPGSPANGPQETDKHDDERGANAE